MNADLKDLVDSNFGRHVSLTPEMYDFFEESFTQKTFDSHEFVVEAGATARYFYLVQSGVQALYLINHKGEKVILGFSFDGSPSGMYDSLILNRPSELFLEAITPSILWGMNQDKFNLLFERFPEFYRWRTHFTEAIFFGRVSREVEILSLTAKERFDAFTKRCPKELLQIPQKYLASYLNMQPETFSRLRAQRD